MNAPGRVGAYILLAVVALLVLLFSLGAVSYVTVLRPSYLESILDSSGIYEDLGAVEADLLFVEVDRQDEAVRAVIDGLTPYFEQALTPAMVRDITDEVVGGVDRWLKGDTPTPEFAVDTATIRTRLNEALIMYAKTQSQGLPPCSQQDLASYDPLTSGCRPSGDLGDDYYMAWADDQTGELPLLDRDQFTHLALIDDPNAPEWSTVPQVYWAGKISLVLFAAVFVVLSALALIVSHRKYLVLRGLGIVSAFNAFALLLGAAVAGLWAGRTGFGALHAQTPMERGFAEEVLLPIIHALSKGIGAWLAIFGAVWAAIAVVCFVLAPMIKRRFGQRDGTLTIVRP